MVTEWLVAYGVWLGVQLCLKHGSFTFRQLRDELHDLELIPFTGELRALPQEYIDLDMAIVRRGPFDRKPNTPNGMILLRNADVSKYPHPGPKP